MATSATADGFVEALKAGEPRAVEARDRLLRKMSRTHPPAAVTDRQAEVLELVALGLSDGEIAARLWVTRDTVTSHIKQAKRRLGGRTRTHTVVLWLASYPKV